jgi:hypothetical protein
MPPAPAPPKPQPAQADPSKRTVTLYARDAKGQELSFFVSGHVLCVYACNVLMFCVGGGVLRPAVGRV